MPIFRIILFLICFLKFAEASLGSQNKNLKSFQGRMNLFTFSTQNSGTVQLREYSHPSGKVFAVTWKGANLPELNKTFGEHFSDFEAAIKKAKENHRGHGPLQITFKNLHIELSGKMRSVRGRAWLVSEIPEGVSANDIQ